MTSHTLAQLLKHLAEILLALPDGKIDKSLFKILEIASKQLSIGSEENLAKTTLNKTEPSIGENEFECDDLIKCLQENDLEESKRRLEDSKLYTVTTLLELAKKLNISISGRPKKDSIIHTILKSLERDRLDKTIRSRNKPKESDIN